MKTNIYNVNYIYCLGIEFIISYFEGLQRRSKAHGSARGGPLSPLTSQRAGRAGPDP